MMPDPPDEPIVDEAAIEWNDTADFDDGPAPLPVLPLDAPPVSGWPAPHGARSLGRGTLAVGVVSLIVAAASLLAGAAALVGASLAQQAAVAGASAAATAAKRVAESAVVEGPAEVLAPDGLPGVERSAVADVLNAARPLSEGEQRQLDELLAENGRRVVGTSAVTVGASGQLAGVGAAAGPAFYGLSTGRLEVSDDRAAFVPADGQPTLAAVAYELPPSPTVEEPPLSEAAVRSVLRAIARLNGGRPRSAQVRAIVGLLRGSGQQLIVPAPANVDPAVEVTGATTDGAGQLAVHTMHGGQRLDLLLSPGGQVSPQVGPAVKPSAHPGVTAVCITSVGQWVVAAYLVVVGVIALRGGRHTRPLLWAYAAVKVPVGVVAAVAVWSFVRSMDPGDPAVLWATPAMAGVVYPLVLATLMCVRNGPTLGRAA